MNMNLETQTAAKGLSDSAEVLFPVISGGVVVGQVLSGGTSSILVTLMNVLELAILLQYCTVGFPDNVEAFFQALSNGATLFPNPIPLILNQHSPKTSNWYRFATFESSVNILDNCGGVLFMLMTNLIIIAVLRGLKHYYSKSVKLRRRISKLLGIFEWNNVISFVLAGQVDFALGWIAQLSEPDFGTKYGIANFCIGVVSLPSAVIFYILLAVVNRRHQKNAAVGRSRRGSIQAEKVFAKTEVLWKDYNTQVLIGRNFVFAMLLKNTGIVVLVYCLSGHPLAQSCMIFVFSACFFVALCVWKPFKEKMEMVATVINEILWVVQTAIVLAFGINQSVVRDQNSLFNTGWALLATIVVALMFNLIFLTLSIASKIIIYCKRRKISQDRTRVRRILVKKRRSKSSFIGEQSEKDSEDQSMKPSLTTSVKELDSEITASPDQLLHRKGKSKFSIKGEAKRGNQEESKSPEPRRVSRAHKVVILESRNASNDESFTREQKVRPSFISNFRKNGKEEIESPEPKLKARRKTHAHNLMNFKPSTLQDEGALRKRASNITPFNSPQKIYGEETKRSKLKPKTLSKAHIQEEDSLRPADSTQDDYCSKKAHRESVLERDRRRISRRNEADRNHQQDSRGPETKPRQ